MKQKTCSGIAVFLLLWLPQLLFAQRGDPFSKMKPGDWFEVLVSDTARQPRTESWRYQMKYVLNDQHADGSKDYTLTFERIRIVLFNPGQPSLGYDSYYPPYKQGIPQKLNKPAFQAKVDRGGKVLRMKPVSEFPEMHLSELATRKRYGGTSVEMGPLPTETASVISGYILGAVARGEKDWDKGRLYQDSELSFLLSAASFPLADNVVVEGKISNMTPQLREGMSLYLPGAAQEMRIVPDGTFQSTAFLREGTEAWLKFGELNIPLFFQPGDTLRVLADGNDLLNGLQFSGNAGAMAAFGLELAKLDQRPRAHVVPYGAKSFSAEAYMNDQDAYEITFRQLMAKHRTQLSGAAISYYQSRFAFEQANGRLDFLSKTGFRSSPQAPEIFEGFPPRFFKGIDTLPVLMLDDYKARWYGSFLNLFHLYQSVKVGQLNGGSDGFFLGDYVLSLNSLRRYPLYATLADAFAHELSSSNWRSAQTLKPYYEDFIKNCGDTALTNTVREKWSAVSAWAPGNRNSLQQFRLADGSLFHLSRFKGKVLSMTFNFHYPDQLKRLLSRIRKQDPDKIHFLIVQLKQEGYARSAVEEELRKLPQVTYVEVTRDHDDLEDVVLLSNFDVKTFVIDAEQRVVLDNIDDSPERLSQDKSFEEAVRKALAPKTRSKEDQAELIKTIGWSAGSILFASLIFFWIYRVRVAALKRNEAIRRKIKELEIKAIRSQMNPHFLFNALNSIQSLINNKQYREANFYLEKFSLLMRRVLNNSEKIFIPLSDELEAVSLYAELEQLRFSFDFSLHLDEGVNASLIEIPGMIIQPLVENAIVHGLAQKGSSGRLEIRIWREKNGLNITIKDNGRGLGPTGQSHSGFGLKLVKERLHLLNLGGGDGKVSLSNNSEENNSGVTAELIIPID